MIKLSSPYVDQDEKDAVCRVLDSHVLNMGVETREFERELKNFWGREDINVCCVNSCTAALQIAMQSHGIGNDDEVLVPSFTFVSTFQAVSATGAIPIPVDIDIDDGFISIDDIKNRISKKTRCIIPVLFAGCDQKIDKIYDFADHNNLIVIEDAAHSFGDEDIIKRAGTLCFSFDAIKNITCSDGGAIVTSNNEVYNKLKDIRLLGVIGDTEARYNGQRSWNSDTVDQGWRYHMSNICASIGRAQLRKFEGIIKYRRQLYSRMYVEGLHDIEWIKLFPIKYKTSVPHIFPIILPNENVRNHLKKYLLDNGIESGIQYKPNHLLTKFNRGYNLPKTEELYSRILSIPVHPRLSEDEVSYIIDKIRNFKDMA